MLTLLSPVRADLLAPSDQPPAGLAPAAVPQFILLGFDDNPQVEPMTWFVDFLDPLRNPAGTEQAATFDGAPVRAAFYTNGMHTDRSADLAALHARAYRAGHEVANHTQHHHHGGAFTVEEWRRELRHCTQALIKAGIPAEAITGFRTPFLEYNAATFEALVAEGFVYDTTLEEGGQDGQDGTNFLWPYTLDAGSPGNAAAAEAGAKERVAPHPGFWEIPIHVFLVPADADCERLGVPVGLRARIDAHLRRTQGYGFDLEEGKITGLDWNVLEWAGVDGPDFLAILKHTLERRLAGNRAPLMVGGHTALYPSDKPDRRAAIEDFLRHALEHPDVRIVTPERLLEWLRAPQPLR